MESCPNPVDFTIFKDISCDRVPGYQGFDSYACGARYEVLRLLFHCFCLAAAGAGLCVGAVCSLESQGHCDI
jgi:hypothetical protein